MKSVFVVISGLCLGVSLLGFGVDAVANCDPIFTSGLNRKAETVTKNEPVARMPLGDLPSLTPSLFIANTKSVFSMAELEHRMELGADVASKRVWPYLEEMAQRGPERFVVSPSNPKQLDALYLMMPNFKSVLDEIRNRILVAIETGQPLKLPPIILLGPPGVGKTKFSMELGKAFGVDTEVVSMNGVTASWVLAGSAPTWEGAQPGKFVEAVLRGQYANPFMVIDEVDKASRDQRYDPMAPLYQLLERKTARVFDSEFLGMKLNLDAINFIMTANDLSTIPQPIVNRALVFRIPKPNHEQLRVIVHGMFNDYLADNPMLRFSRELSNETLDKLAGLPPRSVGLVIPGAVGRALAAGRRHIEPKDVSLEGIELIEDDTTPKRRIGF